jgi:hypothetical protein
MLCSAVLIACSDEPKEGPSQKVDRATDRTLDVEPRRVDADVDRDAPREPGANARERVDAAGERIEGAADRAGEKIEGAADRAGEKIERAADKAGDKLDVDRDADAPRAPGDNVR